MHAYVLLCLSFIILYFISLQTLLVMLFIGVLSYFGGILICRYKNNYLLFLLVICMLVPLFIVRTPSVCSLHVFGTAFAVLKGISYIADIFRGKIIRDNNPLNIMLYMIFIPNVFLGPIISYDSFIKQAKAKSVFEADIIAEGSYRIALGLFMKLVIANRLMELRELTVSNNLRGIIVFVMLLAYSVELYMDFAGGINMAIGAGILCGISLPENFKMPYLSTSLSEFWRRWHITMSGWFKEYVFYPLSLNRRGKRILKSLYKKMDNKKVNEIMFYISLMVTWLLTGLWHGFMPRYVAWGLLNGLIICLEKRFSLENKQYFGFNKALKIVGVYILVSLLRIFDCYDGVYSAGKAFISIFTIKLGTMSELISVFTLPFMVSILGIFLVLVNKRLFKTFAGKCAGIVFFIVASVLLGKYGLLYDGLNFIYGNF